MVSIVRTAGCMAFLIGFGSANVCRAQAAAPPEPASVEIGMPDSLFFGIPKWLIETGAAPFKKMMKDSTGINGNLRILPDPMTLARELDQGKVQIGVMQGYEFAWAKSKYPQLDAIAMAVPMREQQTFCLVKWDSKAANIHDLKEGKISLPPLPDYCQLYFAKIKDEHMKGAQFAGQLKASSGTDAIEQVIDGKSECTIVDSITLNWYQKIYPGPYKNLKILCQSKPFPNACIVVKKGQLSDDTIQRFAKALMDAKNDPVGKPMLDNWKLLGFSRVPADYDAKLKAIEEAYPLPPALRAATDK